MFKRLKESSLLFWSLEILIVASLIWVCTNIGFLFQPIGTFLNVVFMPIVISGFLFYMLNPLVKVLMKVHYKKFRINRTGAVAIVFVLLIGILAWGAVSLIPRLINQVSQLVSNLPSLASELQKEATKLVSNSTVLKKVDVSTYMKQFNGEISKYAQNFLSSLSTSIVTVITTITSVTIMAITIPVILFYMLKDSEKFIPAISRFLPRKQRPEIVGLIQKMGDTISSYISGQVIECLFVGTFTAIGYMLISQPYGLLLGVVAGIANIIPYLGPYIGIAPSLIVAFTQSPMQVVYVVIVVVIVQQVDGNLIYPNIIGRTLKIHPLTIIILLLAAGNIAGLLGMVLAIPFYAVVRTVVIYLFNIVELRNEEELRMQTTVYQPQPAKASKATVKNKKKS
ncbi:membrane protein [Lactiplantibacillus fabifermentans T30PCM01]|uniref:Membrane protein n=1 Tax=Lactiplantibacillus fabifermentans T30PCM01 TaxID=1400520 RepID=W6T8K7_9LACO|nr:AI-2E family transporter [Lactiplantibacillus fabifermentans]ETY74697.1 membrane protein [Lactiplantibacillus fabifermentans T30PCM01]